MNLGTTIPFEDMTSGKGTTANIDGTPIRDIDVKEILPQRSPMLMIDQLTEWSESSATTEFEIREGNIFLMSCHSAADTKDATDTADERGAANSIDDIDDTDDADGKGSMTPEGIIENVAQTCAAKIEYYNKYILHLPVNIGYIGEIRNFSITRLPHIGETLVTKVVVEQEVFGISLISASVSCGGEVIATGKMKIAIKEQS